MKRIAVDMDEVLADFTGKCLEVMNAYVGTSFTKDDLYGKTVNELYPDHSDFLVEVVQAPDFFRRLDVIEESQSSLKRLSEHYEIVIATAAMDVPTSFQAKYDWLLEHFDFLDPRLFIFCGDKKVVQADYLIDDNIYQLNAFTGRGIMFDAPHNLPTDYNVRASNWLEVEAYLMKELDSSTASKSDSNRTV